MKDIRIGNDIEISWRIYEEDGITPYNLSERDLSLFLCDTYSSILIKEYTTDYNEIRFIFHGKDQRRPGIYSLKLIENNGKTDMHTVDSCDAFNLVRNSCEAGGDDSENVNTVSVVLKSSLQGYSGNNVREIFLPVFETNDDGSVTITKDLTPEQKAYNAETYAMLERGESPLLHIQQWIVYRFLLGTECYVTVEVLGGLMKCFFSFTIEPNGDISDIAGVIYFCLYNFHNPKLVVEFAYLFETVAFAPIINEIIIIPYGETEGFTQVDRFYLEGETLAIEFNKGDKRYKQTFNKNTGNLIEETDITPAGFSRLLYIPAVDEDYNIIGELTPKEKEYNAETARRLRNGEPITLTLCHMGEAVDFAGNTTVNADDISYYSWAVAGDSYLTIDITLQNDGTISYINHKIYYGTYPFFSPEAVLEWLDNYPRSVFYGRVTDNYDGIGLVTANAVFIDEVFKCVIADYTLEGKNIRRYYSVVTGKMVHEEVLSSGGVDPELLEGLMPMSRDFSDDFNNDFAR